MTKEDKRNVLAELDELARGTSGVVRGTIEDCRRAVGEMPEEDGWIPVTERMPDDWVDVLARLQCGDCVVAVKSGPIWRERFTNIRLECRDISHWMPLPEPPKEEEK